MHRTLVILLISALPAYAQQLSAFRWISQVEASGSATFAGVGADREGNVYAAGSTKSPEFPVLAAVQKEIASKGRSDVFVRKYDASGKVTYSTYFGGSGDDIATAMAVDPSGNVYVTGTTTSSDFPTSRGVYSPAPPSQSGPALALPVYSFLFKLTPDGQISYSTYFAAPGTQPRAIGVDPSGSVYLTGMTTGGLATTPGAYRSTCDCGAQSNGFFSLLYTDAFLARFDPAASKLVFSTYLGMPTSVISNSSVGAALAVAPDGSAYVPGSLSISRFDPTGSRLLARAALPGEMSSVALASDGSLYMAGVVLATGPDQFQPTAGAFQTSPRFVPPLAYQCCGGSHQGAVLRIDSQLRTILAGTYFGTAYGNSPKAIAIDSEGNVYLGGSASPRSLPTLTPFVQGFGFFAPGYGKQATGYLAKLTGGLTTLLFSSPFGDDESFSVSSLAIALDGSVLLGGRTTSVPSLNEGNVWINSLVLAPPPQLRIDEVVNAASQLSDPLSGGETILIRGSGFSGDSQVIIGGAVVSPISVSPSAIAVVTPANLADDTRATTTTIQVTSEGASSNTVLAAVSTTSPGLFAVDGTGMGQGYILNADGSLNSPENPAVPGDRITIFATGVGAVSFREGYAVTQSPVTVLADGIYCNGVAAVMRTVAGLPGDVYQLTVILPSPETLAIANPDLKNFKFPPRVGIVLRIAEAPSQNGLFVSVAQ